MRPAFLTITNATYDFLSLLPSSESLTSRGRRLHDTAAQRQKATYAPDVLIKVEVAEATHKLLVNFIDDQRLVLAQGENKPMRLWFSNMGTNPVREVWMVAGPEDEIWIGGDQESDAPGKKRCALPFPWSYWLSLPRDIIDGSLSKPQLASTPETASHSFDYGWRRILIQSR